MKIDGSVGMDVYTTVASGELAGSTTALQMSDIPCKLAWFSAYNTNPSSVFVGASTITVPDGSADATSGLELEAGDMLGPLPIPNLNVLYYICNSSADELLYFVLR